MEGKERIFEVVKRKRFVRAKNNVVMYRVPELDSDDVLERRCGDVA